MAPIRISATALQRRRRSSLALTPFTPTKPGFYGITRPVTFAPNVTPVTFTETDSTSEGSLDVDSAGSTLFPPSDDPTAAFLSSLSSSRRRAPPGKRRSQGYIPRPPNAFMLFRADFVRQKHVPGSIEANHGSLSKIIGNCWRALPLDEKRVWEVKAKHAKAEHKARYPNYRFKPVHNKNKDKKKDKTQPAPEDERRCEEVAQLLLEGKKGDELAAAVRNLDRLRSQTPTSTVAVAAPVALPAASGFGLGGMSGMGPIYPHRRSLSVPPPSDFYFLQHHNQQYANVTLPSLPFFTGVGSRPSSPVSISRQQRIMLGQRRPSSAGPAMLSRSWSSMMMGHSSSNTLDLESGVIQQDNTPLPEVDTSLFNSSWSSSFPTANTNVAVAGEAADLFQFNDVLGASGFVAPHQQFAPRSPLDTTPSAHTAAVYTPVPEDSGIGAGATTDVDLQWMSMELASQSSTVYSGSPEPAENLAAMGANLVLHAPQPQSQHSQQSLDLNNIGLDDLMFSSTQQHVAAFHSQQQSQSQQQQSYVDLDLGLDLEQGFAVGVDFSTGEMCGSASNATGAAAGTETTGADAYESFQAGLDSIFGSSLPHHHSQAYVTSGAAAVY
ncbi:hypothetical protein AMATHDRAFT_65996 [Amanita thiersii Skay4041]|uniref:HMG box domain-containing protein n=1 Tax=Amanita thiersii Skay4041 TaxID=703135 RepID=A0A2A9NG01_9AGAR|nr:hypothetical protein AMATHDRAFT_65996 [Amanita thiersii Skay4041]